MLFAVLNDATFCSVCLFLCETNELHPAVCVCLMWITVCDSLWCFCCALLRYAMSFLNVISSKENSPLAEWSQGKDVFWEKVNVLSQGNNVLEHLPLGCGLAFLSFPFTVWGNRSFISLDAKGVALCMPAQLSLTSPQTLTNQHALLNCSLGPSRRLWFSSPLP